VDNLQVVLSRDGLHAPNDTPNDGLTYRTIHDAAIQAKRQVTRISCGPDGTIHDYVPFYFGYLSPMMLQLKTGRVPGYSAGQDPLIYLVTTAQALANAGVRFVFSDGHGIAAFTSWFDDLAHLSKVDWSTVYERYWQDTADDMDRQRRKQAEFLVHRFCSWSFISEIGVIDVPMKARVETILAGSERSLGQTVAVRPEWYYY